MKISCFLISGGSWFFPADWPRIEAVTWYREGKMMVLHGYATEQHTGLLISCGTLSLYNRAERHVFFNVLRRDKYKSGAPLYPNPPAVNCISCVFWRGHSGREKEVTTAQRQWLAADFTE